ncbi:lipase [Nocardioides mangrovicus]|uniref:Lipase n=1 Tax=Nocardioides mangrovicus TaxID=2478913 RepID=A0A3L8P5G0_9ACTN|nr:lipase [Nocardioides mangrovicus]RLV49628.1 lipase [Nocardioides mangrovicus]
MLESLAPARRRLVIAVAGVVVLAVVVAVAVVVVRRMTGGGVADQATPGPVVLVPGYGADLAALDPLARTLVQQGRTSVVFRPADDGTGDLRAEARALGRLVDRTLTSSHAESVDLVGYSAGGVVARLYVRDDGGRHTVRRVLTIGSPHHGTDVAQLAEDVAGSCPTACEQLATGSDLIQRLDAGDETPTGPRWVTVRSSSDRTVVPTDSAELAGALNVLVQEVCPGRTTSHGALPGDPVVLATLRSALGRAVPSRPRAACGGLSGSADG